MRDGNSDREIIELRAQLMQLAEEGRRLTRIAEELCSRIAGPPGHRKRGGHLRLVKGVLIGAGAMTGIWRLLRSTAAGAIAGGLTAVTVTAVTVPLVLSSPPHPRRARPPAAVWSPTRRAALVQPDIDLPAAHHAGPSPSRSPSPSTSRSSCTVQGVVLLPSCQVPLPTQSAPPAASGQSPSPSPSPSPSDSGDGQGQQNCDVLPLPLICLTSGLNL